MQYIYERSGWTLDCQNEKSKRLSNTYAPSSIATGPIRPPAVPRTTVSTEPQTENGSALTTESTSIRTASASQHRDAQGVHGSARRRS